jgi:hypothetical protein
LFLEDKLSRENRLKLNLEDDSVPFCFPFLIAGDCERKQLWDHGIYLPQLWEECLHRNIEGFTFERYLSRSLLPLPIDQRYSEEEMGAMVKALINNNLIYG